MKKQFIKDMTNVRVAYEEERISKKVFDKRIEMIYNNKKEGAYDEA